MANPKNTFSNDEIGQLLKSGSVLVAKRSIKSNFPLIKISENVFDLLGYKAESLLQSKPAWIDLIHQDDKQQVLDLCESALNDKDQKSLNYKIKNADGN